MASSLSSSNVTPPPIANQAAQAEDKFTSFIDRRLRLTGNHVKLVDLFGGLMMLCGFVLASLLLLCVVDAWVFELSAALRIIALLSILVVSIGYFTIKLLPLLIRRINPAYAAKMIEDGHPEFKNSLLNHVFFKRDPRGAKPVVAGAVHRKAAEDISHITIETAVDRGFLIRAGYFFAAMLAVFGLYKILSPKDPFTTVARIVAPFAEISRPSRVQIDEVKPGDVEIFFGEKLTVEARVGGVGDDELVNLVFSSEDGQIVDRHILMKRDEEKKIYYSNLGSSDAGVQQNLTYWIKAGDGESRRFTVIVKPRPSFVVQSVKIAPPAYTQLESFELQQGNLASVEGATVTVHALANLPIDVAFIQLLALPENDGQQPADSATVKPEVEPKFVESVSMQVTNDTEAVGKFWLQMQSDRLAPLYTHYRVGFLTKDGIGNENATVYRIQTTPDLKPEIELVQPRETISQLPENRRTRIQVQAFDPDYQLTDIRLVGDRRGSHLFEKSILKENSQIDGQIDVVYQFDPREFGLRSGDEVLIHALALDNRHAPISDVIDPNVAKSKQIRIQIKPAVEDPEGADSSSTEDSQQGDPQNQDQNQNQTDNPNPRESQQSKSDRNENSKTDTNDQKQDADAGKDASKEAGKSDEESKENSQSETQQKNDQSKSGESDKQESRGGGGSNSDSSQQDSSQSKNDGDQSGSKSSGDQSKEGNQPNQGSGGGKSNQKDSSQNTGQNDVDPRNSSQTGNDSSQSKPNGGQAEQQNVGQQDVDQQSQDATDRGSSDSNEPVDHPGDAFQRIKKHVEQTKNPDQDSQDSQASKSDAADADNQQQKSETKPDETTDGNSQQKPEGDKQSGSRQDESKQDASSKENSSAKENGSKQDDSKQNGSKQNGSKQNGAKKDDAKQDDAKQAGSKKDNSESNTGGAKQDGSKEKGREDNQPNDGGVDDNGEKKDGDNQEGVKESGSKKEDADKEGAGKDGDAKNDSEKSDDEKDAVGKDGDAQVVAPEKTGKQDGSEGTGNEKTGSESSKEDESQKSGDKNGAQKGQDQKEGGDQAKSGENQTKSGKTDGSQQTAKKQQDSADQQADSNRDADEQSGDSTNKKSGKSKTDDSNQDNQSTEGASKPGGGNGNRQRSDNDTNDAADESPDGDEANLEYARKATDLVLDFLKDHKDDVDNELLDDLNWSPEEMRDFYEKWEQMRKAAEQGGAAERKRYEEALRSLGLRPGREGVEGENIQQQKIEGLLEKGNRSQPPAHLLEEFRSFNKGRSRANNR